MCGFPVSSYDQVVEVTVASFQFVPSEETWTFSPVPSAALIVPETTRVVSEVMKSVEDAPVSFEMAVIAAKYGQ